MKPVNLLPERHRPRRPTGGRQGSSYVVLGVLGVVLLMVVGYVFTVNAINSDRDAIAQAEADTEEAQAKTRSLAAYGDFAKVKEQRVTSIKQLAQGRFDWERLVRELAHVLPEDVWITKADASASGKPAEGASASSAPPAAGAAGGTPPTAVIAGCAKTQREVAVTLVRLRQLQGADDVKLKRSGKAENLTDSQGNGGSSSASSGDTGCGETAGRPNYGFEAEISFKPQAPSQGSGPGKVPARLGGGA